MKKILFLGFIFCINLVGSELILMSEDYPPYNYPDTNNKATGISVDIVKLIIKETGDKDNITILPWARSYHNIQTKKDQVLFVMTRTKTREKLFKWVGPVASNNWVIFAKKNFKDNITSLNDIKNNNYTIGTYKNDACEIFLKNNGFKNISSVPDDSLNVKKLLKNRIDLWIVGEYQGILKAKRFNKASKIKKVFDVKKTQLYIAFSRTTPNSVINLWQQKLDEMKKDGRYQAIVDKYIK
jgi:polar amino acid transport system substrate-binding protein